MLYGDDVLDLERECDVFLRNAAILAPFACPMSNAISLWRRHSDPGNREHFAGFCLQARDNVDGFHVSLIFNTLGSRQNSFVGLCREFVNACLSGRVGPKYHKSPGDIRRKAIGDGSNRRSKGD